MDQDSIFVIDGAKKLLDYIRANDNCGLVGPNLKRVYRDAEGQRIITDEVIFPEIIEKTPWVITSGSVFRLSEYIQAGGVDTQLFIGQIDQDYCCKVVNRLHKDVVRIGNVFMYQEAANTTKRKILNRIVHVPNYNPKRYYYIFRNEQYLRKKWGGGTGNFIEQSFGRI